MSSYADDGISEVVGFICILVLITVVLAVWAAGSVPAGELWEDQIQDPQRQTGLLLRLTAGL